MFDDNAVAIKLYESEGFVCEGTLRDSFVSEGGYRSQRIYAMLENEYYLSLRGGHDEAIS